MGRALYKERELARAAPRQSQSFGIAPTLGVLVAFLAIHAHLAFRVPLSQFEAGILVADPSLPFDLPFALAHFGTTLMESAAAQRIGFLGVSFATSLAVFVATRRMSDVALAPAVAVIWLNTTIVFGIGSVFATREACGALALALVLIGLATARNGPGMAGWSIAFAGLIMAWLSHATAAWALIALPIVPILDRPSRIWLRQSGFFAFLGLSLAAVLWAGPSVEPSLLPRDLAAGAGIMLLAFGPGVLFFAGLGQCGAFGLAKKIPGIVALPAAMVLALTAALALGAADLSDMAMLAPPLCVMAAVTAAQTNSFARNCISEIATPFAFLSLLLAIYIAAVPTNNFLPRIPWISGVFGWQGAIAEIKRHGPPGSFLLTDDPDLARTLSSHAPNSVFHMRANGPGAPLQPCAGPGLFVTRAGDATALMGRFRQIVPVADVPRMAGAWAVDVFSVYAVTEPTASASCATPDSQ